MQDWSMCLLFLVCSPVAENTCMLPFPRVFEPSAGLVRQLDSFVTCKPFNDIKIRNEEYDRNRHTKCRLVVGPWQDFWQTAPTRFVYFC